MRAETGSVPSAAPVAVGALSSVVVGSLIGVKEGPIPSDLGAEGV